MSLILQDVLDFVVSHAMTTGHFDRVNSHEPKSAPGNGLYCAVWVDKVTMATSGLDKASATITLKVRVGSNMIAEPQDGIDPQIMNAVDALLTNYIGDFTFDGTVRNIDLFGSDSEGLSVDAGYVEQDRKMFRIMDINLPIIINDLWTETA
jgi:hypothetical protein